MSTGEVLGFLGAAARRQRFSRAMRRAGYVNLSGWFTEGLRGRVEVYLESAAYRAELERIEKEACDETE